MSKLEEIRERCPFPWRYVAHPNGFLQLLDSTDNEVPLFVLLDLAVLVTSHHKRKTEASTDA